MAQTPAAMNSSETRDQRHPATSSRVGVVFERGRRGEAALRQASRLAAAGGSELVVVVVASQATETRCCGPSPADLNCAVREQAGDDLRRSATLLGDSDAGVVLTLLVEGRDPSLPEWAAAAGLDLILLPARRGIGRSRGHPALRELRRVLGDGVRVAGAPSAPA